MAQMYQFPQNGSNNMKTHLICNTIKVVAGIAVIGYVCKMTRSPWPLVAMVFIPQSSFSTDHHRPNENKATEQDDIPEELINEENDKEETPNE